MSAHATQTVTGGAKWAFSALRGRAALAPRIAEFALVILLGVLIAKILLSLFAPLPLPKGDRLAAVSNGARKPAADLVVVNPFPSAEIAVAGPIEAAPDVAETTLNLKLTGVIPDGDNGAAIIELSNGQQQRFAVGDEIESGARLAAVFWDQVIIERAGARESLRFETKADFAPPAAPKPVSGFIADAVRVQPAVDELGAPAFRIFAGSDEALFAKLGLEDGDILTSINGRPVGADASAFTALLASVQNGEPATIVVDRDGTPKAITISLSSLGNN